MRGNVEGTQNALEASRGAGVRRFVHVGTEAALLAGEPLVEVDERAPLRFDSPALYSETKARAEEAVVEAAGQGFETVVIRPRLVWGPGDTTILPALVEAVKAGRFAWIGGGRHTTSTTHVDNVVEGLLLGAERGASRRRLLRHRRDARRLSRVRHPPARDPGRRGAGALGSEACRPRARRCVRIRVVPAPAPR